MISVSLTSIMPSPSQPSESSASPLALARNEELVKSQEPSCENLEKFPPEFSRASSVTALSSDSLLSIEKESSSTRTYVPEALPAMPLTSDTRTSLISISTAASPPKTTEETLKKKLQTCHYPGAENYLIFQLLKTTTLHKSSSAHRLHLAQCRRGRQRCGGAWRWGRGAALDVAGGARRWGR